MVSNGVLVAVAVAVLKNKQKTPSSTRLFGLKTQKNKPRLKF
jgi:hypothetical protein